MILKVAGGVALLGAAAGVPSLLTLYRNSLLSNYLLAPLPLINNIYNLYYTNYHPEITGLATTPYLALLSGDTGKKRAETGRVLRIFVG